MSDKVGQSGRMFLGTFFHTLDDKNRLNLPAKFFSMLSKTIYLSVGFEGSLELRTEQAFNEHSNQLLKNSSNGKDARHVQDYFFANTFECEIDGAKRILIPTILADKAVIKKNVVIVGSGDKIKIWDENNYKKYLSQIANSYEQTADKLVELQLKGGNK